MQNTDAASANPLEITTSRQFLSWLDEQKLSIVLTTYQIGKLFLLGLKPNGTRRLMWCVWPARRPLSVWCGG